MPDWIGTVHPLEGWPAVASAVVTRDTVQLCSLDDPRRGPIEVDELRRYGYEAELVVPLIAKGRVIGVADLLDRERREFSPGTVGAVEAVCRAAAFAIDNANLFEAVQLRSRETELLNAIARRTASSLELDEIAAATVEELRQIVAFERAELILADGGERLETIYSSDEHDVGAGPREASAAQRAALEAIRRELVVVWESGAAPSFDGRGGEDGEAGASIALLHDDQLIGVLGLTGSEPHDFASVDRHVLERVGTHLALAIHNARLYDEIKRMHLGNLKALTSALNAKDYYTLGHAARVGAYMVLLGHELGWSEETIRQVEEAAYLHDIGKIGVSDRVLLKPSGLNSLEWELMRQHPIFSADILRPLFDGRPRARRAPSPRALGRRRVPRRPGRRGDPPGRAGHVRGRLVRRHVVPPALPPGAALPRGAGRARPLQRARSSTPRWCAPSSACSRAWPEQRAEARERRRARRGRGSTPTRTTRCAPRATSREPRTGTSQARLRAVRDEHPEVRFLTTVVRRRRRRRAPSSSTPRRPPRSTRRSAARSSPTTSCSRPSPEARPTSTCSTSTSGASG